MKIALAHDWLNQMGGAENVLERLVELFPGAPIFTTIYGPELMPEAYRRWDIRPTWLNRAPAIHRHHQPYLPLYPPAVESMNFSGYDLILSNKSGFIHGLRHTSEQLHICYCLTPTRYVWDYGSYAARERFGRWLGWVMGPAIQRLRQWDFEAAQQTLPQPLPKRAQGRTGEGEPHTPTPSPCRGGGEFPLPDTGRGWGRGPAGVGDETKTNLSAPEPKRDGEKQEASPHLRGGKGVDYFIAISTDIQARIKKYYQRDSVIIYPPVDTRCFHPLPADQSPDNFYLIVSRLIPYKRIDLAVQALTRLGKRLIIVGDGRDRAKLEALAGPTVEFKGRLPGDAVAELMANCRAFLFPGFEDFGIAPVEAQAAGRPVIAFGQGGALDTVVEGQTGLFFREQSVDALIEAIEQFETMSFDPVAARANAERFSVERFKQELGDFVTRKAR